MIDLKNVYEIRNVLNDKVIDKIEEVQTGKIWYESWKKILKSGKLPLTLNKCKGVDLVDYKIHGESIQGQNLYVDGNRTFTDSYWLTLTKPLKAGTYTISAIFNNDNDAYNQGLIFYAGEDNKAIGNKYYTKGERTSHTVTFTVDIYHLIFYATHSGATNPGVTATYADIQIKAIPTPQAPAKIKSVGDKTNNLLNKSTSNIGYTINSAGVMSKANYGLTVTEPIYVKTSTTYTYSGMGDVVGTTVSRTGYMYKQDGTPIKAIASSNGVTRTFTTTEDCEYVRLIYKSNEETPMLIQGSTATDYEPYGYKISVRTGRKNLLPNDVLNINSYEYAYDLPYKSVYKLPFIKPNRTYTISFDYENKAGEVYYYLCSYKNGEMTEGYMITGATPNGKITYQFTSVEGAEYFFYGNNEYAYLPRALENISNFQIEEGTQATDYEPYVEPIITNIYLDEPLRKIDEYVDYIDFKNQQVIRQIHRINLGECTWTSNNATNAIYYTNVKNTGDPIGVYTGRCFSNVLKADSISGSNNNTGIAIYGGGIVRTRPDLTVFDTVEKWQEYLENNESYLLYAIDDIPEPIELPNIPTLKDTTVLNVDTTIQPSNAEIIYLGKE